MAIDLKTLAIGGAAVAGAFWYVNRQQVAAAAAATDTTAQSPSRWDQFTGGLMGALGGGKSLFDGLSSIADAWKPSKPKDAAKPAMLPKDQDPWGHLLRSSAGNDVLGTRPATGRVLPRNAANADYLFSRLQTLKAAE